MKKQLTFDINDLILFDMQTVVVEIKSQKAFALLQELEDLDLLKIIKENVLGRKINLSEKYRGVFTIADAESFNTHTQTMRKEWNDT